MNVNRCLFREAALLYRWSLAQVRMSSWTLHALDTRWCKPFLSQVLLPSRTCDKDHPSVVVWWYLVFIWWSNSEWNSYVSHTEYLLLEPISCTFIWRPQAAVYKYQFCPTNAICQARAKAHTPCVHILLYMASFQYSSFVTLPLHVQMIIASC